MKPCVDLYNVAAILEDNSLDTINIPVTDDTDTKNAFVPEGTLKAEQVQLYAVKVYDVETGHWYFVDEKGKPTSRPAVFYDSVVAAHVELEIQRKRRLTALVILKGYEPIY